jgi:predicted metal-dependent phosphoesterase TrpH
MDRIVSEHRLSAADLHVHTTFSDGAPTPAMVVTRAVERGLAVVAITDHDTIDGALEAAGESARCEVVVGEEISTSDGHVLGLFLSERVRPGMPVAMTVDAIHEQGGLAVPAHPYLNLGGARGVGAAGEGLAWDAVEVVNGSPGAWYANRTAQRRSDRWASARTGGSDAHILDAVATVVTLFEGRTAVELRAAIAAGTTRAARPRRAGLVAFRTLVRSVRRRLDGDAARELARRRAQSGQR